MPNAAWNPVGAVAPEALREARVTAHWAAQPVAAAARALIAPVDDDSHTNLIWSPDARRFVTRPFSGGERLSFDPRAMRIGLSPCEGAELGAFKLRGVTLDRAFVATGELLVSAGLATERTSLAKPEYDLPDAPVGRGATFPRGGQAAFEELANWFGNASTLLESIARSELGGVEVRTWPHHFDMAALLELDGPGAVENGRSLNVGFSPGDATIDEPYVYLTPWPVPELAEPPAFEDGLRWHTDGFSAAVIEADTLCAAGNSAEARDALMKAIHAAVRTLRGYLGPAR